MPMRYPECTTSLLAFFLVVSACGISSSDDASLNVEKRLPNVLLLIADDLGYGELGCQGNQQIPTPHIDSIAKNGIRFTQGYVTAPFCSASRAGLMTGRMQTRFGYEFNPIGAKNEDPNEGLPVGERTLADHLVDAGYVNGLVGKWHLGGTAKYNPIRRGFDEFFGFMHEGHYFLPSPYSGSTTWLRRKTLPGGGKGRWTSRDGKTIYSTHMGGTEPDYDADNPIYRDGQPVVEREYLTDAFTREAVSFINRNADRPFFLCVSYNAVHSPMQGAENQMQRFKHIEDVHRRIFAAMLGNLDDSIGKVLEAVRANGLEENTLIFFLSDNGGPTKELTSSNLPLREGKGSMYEGGLRVPFMVQWKGQLNAGSDYDFPVTSMDIFGTVAELAKVKLDPKKTYDGVNLLPYLQGKLKTRPHEQLFWRVGERTAIRVGDYKLLSNQRRKQKKSWELYDLATDFGEKNELSSTHPEKKHELLENWEKLNSEMIDPISPR